MLTFSCKYKPEPCIHTAYINYVDNKHISNIVPTQWHAKDRVQVTKPHGIDLSFSRCLPHQKLFICYIYWSFNIANILLNNWKIEKKSPFSKPSLDTGWGKMITMTEQWSKLSFKETHCLWEIIILQSIGEATKCLSVRFAGWFVLFWVSSENSFSLGLPGP